MIELVLAAAAQYVEPPPVIFPRLAPAGPTAQSLVPPGWRIVRQATGDLNRDRKNDIALLLRMTSRRNLVPIADTSPPETFDTNPYLLVVAFAAPNGGYRIAVSSHRVFQRPDMPYSGNVSPSEADSLRIERGTLLLANEYLRGHDRYRFRWDGRAFRLIGYDSAGTSGNCVETVSINYLTGRARWSDRPVEGGRGEAVSRRLKPGPTITLETFDIAEFIPSDMIAGPPPTCRPD